MLKEKAKNVSDKYYELILDTGPILNKSAHVVVIQKSVLN
jgi:hypothetical protein